MTRRPSILFVNQHYWPDVAATGQVLSDLAEYLVGEGYRVGVLCSRGRYEGGRVEAPDREIRREWIQRILDHDGYEIGGVKDPGGIEAWLVVHERTREERRRHARRKAARVARRRAATRGREGTTGTL